MNTNTHHSIREAIRKRIVAGEWQLGALIPGEVEFAEEYACSRTTVNRALQALAEEGIVERKRRGGTRVSPLPAPQAQFAIPLVREQVEERGLAYITRVTAHSVRMPDAKTRKEMRLSPEQECAYLESLHLADEQVFAFECRWINLASVPQFKVEALGDLSANEWLVREVPFSRGTVALGATTADSRTAETMRVEQSAPLFTMRRTTWLGEASVTAMTLFYAPGYELGFAI
ncbi:MAG: GntR family transcriptional regulator [Qipengyuania vulgaris]